MKCLCCGKTITAHASESEKKWQWHSKCVKKFFQTEEMPVLDITKDQLESLANETVNEGLTVPGVQKKLSLHLSSDLNARLTIVDYPTGYILKPQTEEFENMPEFEDLAMRLAELMGIQTVPLALTINGKKRNIHKKEFRALAESCEIPANAGEHMIERVCFRKDKLINQVEEAYLSEEQKEKVKELISERIEILSGRSIPR